MLPPVYLRFLEFIRYDKRSRSFCVFGGPEASSALEIVGAWRRRTRADTCCSRRFQRPSTRQSRGGGKQTLPLLYFFMSCLGDSRRSWEHNTQEGLENSVYCRTSSCSFCLSVAFAATPRVTVDVLQELCLCSTWRESPSKRKHPRSSLLLPPRDLTLAT